MTPFSLCASRNLDDDGVYRHGFFPHFPSIYACNPCFGTDDQETGSGEKISRIPSISRKLALIPKPRRFRPVRQSNQICYIMYIALYLNVIQNFTQGTGEKSWKKVARAKLPTLLFVVHLPVENYSLSEALTVLIFNFQTTERTFPLLNGRIRQKGSRSCIC